MRFSSEHLETLLAIVDHGTFEAAADELRISPSAVSQRVRALESQVGQVVVVRSTPAQATAAGQPLVRLARQQALLHQETRHELHQGSAPMALPVAVNADSLATWFPTVLSVIAQWPEVSLRLRLDDETRTAHWLRNGNVLAAVTTQPVAVQGCTSRPLVQMRYLPAATPALLARHHATTKMNWQTVPVVHYDANDQLQQRFLDAHQATPTAHQVPSSQGFAAAVRAGLGWGLIPFPQLGSSLDDGLLVPIPGTEPVAVQLYWQVWRLQSPLLDRLTRTVAEAAQTLN